MKFIVSLKDPEPGPEPAPVTLPLPVSSGPQDLLECPLGLLQPHAQAGASWKSIRRQVEFLEQLAARHKSAPFLIVTPQGVIIDGVLTWHAAKLMKRPTILVLVRESKPF